MTANPQPQTLPALPAQDPETWEMLLTFLDFSEDLTIAFIEVNFAADIDVLIETIREHPSCAEMQFQVFNYSQQPELRFLLDDLLERLAQVPEPPSNKKRILVFRGLESSIGDDSMGEYPPMLQDLNFVRDSYRIWVPYPLLFILPDYAITRIAKYAPDFWDWRSGVFLFHYSPLNTH